MNSSRNGGVLRGTRVVLTQVWNHPANDGARGSALARAVAFQFRGRVLGRPTVVGIGERSRIVAHLHRTGSSRCVYGNPPDLPEMLVWRRRLHPDDLFVDVGANIGAYAVYCAEVCGAVVAVEPNPEVVALLRENLMLNGIVAEVHELALAERDGRARFDGTRDATGHLSHEGQLIVETARLDRVIGRRVAHGVKIDVEGHEQRVLEGATAALSEKRIRCLQLEWNDTARRNLGIHRSVTEDLLRDHGYSLHRPDPSGVLHPVARAGEGPDVFALPDS